MAWTRKILRTWSALCLALVVYAATPHVHADSEGAGAATSFAALSAAGLPLFDATSGLRSDDAHESHSPTAELADHPCTLCREQADREIAAPEAVPPSAAAPIARQVEAPEVAARAELLIARRHPARGPPLAC